MYKTIFNKLKNTNFNQFEKFIKYLLIEYGTSLNVNRFDIGNSIEYSLSKHLQKNNFLTRDFHNSKKIDISIENKEFSIKYSSCADIKLHNSNNCINKDCNFTDLLLLTPNNLWFITNETLNDYEINIEKYLVNTGDGLKLKRKLLTALNKKNYEYKIRIDLEIDKKKCKNNYTFKTFYNKAFQDFQELNK